MVDEEKEKQENTKWLQGTVTEGNPNLRALILSFCSHWKFPKSKFHTHSSVIRAVISSK